MRTPLFRPGTCSDQPSYDEARLERVRLQARQSRQHWRGLRRRFGWMLLGSLAYCAWWLHTCGRWTGGTFLALAAILMATLPLCGVLAMLLTPGLFFSANAKVATPGKPEEKKSQAMAAGSAPCN